MEFIGGNIEIKKYFIRGVCLELQRGQVKKGK